MKSKTGCLCNSIYANLSVVFGLLAVVGDLDVARRILLVQSQGHGSSQGDALVGGAEEHVELNALLADCTRIASIVL